MSRLRDPDSGNGIDPGQVLEVFRPRISEMFLRRRPEESDRDGELEGEGLHHGRNAR